MLTIGVIRARIVLPMLALVLALHARASAQDGTNVVAEATDARAPHCASPSSPMAVRACAGLVDVDQQRWLEGEASLESTLALMGPDLESLRPVMQSSLSMARAHLGSIEITCGPVPSAVEVDGALQGVTPLLRPVRVLPGVHHVRCSHEGYIASESDVDVATMSVASASMTLAFIDTRPPIERFGNPGDGQRIVGIVSLSLGGALLAVGFGTLGGALDNPPPLRDQLFDVSRATLIAGGAAVLLGVVLTLTAE